MRQRLCRALGLAFAFVLGLSFFAPVRAFAAEAVPEVGAEAYLVMDAATGQVLVAQNEHMLEYPASVTKIMTLALVLEQVEFETAASLQVEVSQAAVDALIPRATMVALMSGEVATVQDLLYATKIESANDAANALAEYVFGSMDAFCQRMNEKARQLGLSGSHFVNPSGQPAEEHYTTAYDMAEITRWALSVPGFRQLFGATRYSMAPTNRQPAGREFHNANLIQVPHSSYYCEGVTGSKTGYTDQASYTLVTTAERGGTELICVVLNCAYNADKYHATNQLLDYCFDNFARVNYPLGQVPAQQVPVYGGGQDALGEIRVDGSGGEASFWLHRSLGLGAIEVEYQVPERYVVGEDFAPVAVLRLTESGGRQAVGTLASVPLGWGGLEQVLGGAGAAAGSAARQPKPLSFWLAVGIPLLLAALVAGRIAYVQHRRAQRRKRRLLAIKAQMPIRIQDRPPPPARPHRARQNTTVYTRRAAQPPQLRVVESPQPRRVGQAK